MTSPIRPIYLMNENGVDPIDNKAVIEGIETMLKIAGVENKIKILDYDELIGKKYISIIDGSLKEYKNIDWYLQQGKLKSRNSTQINANAICSFFVELICLSEQKHYSVFVVKSDIYSKYQDPETKNYKETYYNVGVAIPFHCAIISTYRFKDKDLEHFLKFEVIKTETMHEIGHIFGIPNKKRKNLDKRLGNHCSRENKCVMRQGMTVDEWKDMTKDRLRSGKPLCDECIDDLRIYFGKKNF